MAKKELKSKPMEKASAVTPYTGMVGGEGNRTTVPNSKKSGAKMAFAKGGKVSIPAHVEGGFRNRAMEHKRG